MLKEQSYKIIFFLLTGLVLILRTEVTAQAQFRMAPARIGDNLTCYGGGESINRRPHPDWDTGYAFALRENNDAQKIFEEVARHTELYETIYMVAVTNPITAEVCQGDKGRYYILFDPDWLLSMYRDTKSIWALRAIIAHEIGHLILNHPIKAPRSNPKMELEADKYAGGVMRKMKAELDDIKIAYLSKEMGNPEGNETHPPIRLRLKAVEAGWRGLSNRDTTSVDNTPSSSVRYYRYPDLIHTSSGKVRPAEGYDWADPDDPKDLRVISKHVIRTGKGRYRPADGYDWVNPNDPNDLRVKPVR